MRRPRHAAGALATALLAVCGVARADAPTWSGDLAIRRCDHAPATLPEGLPQAMAAAVEITAGFQSGTGFLISPDGYALTAAHVVRGHDVVDVRITGRPATHATVLRVSTTQDVALLYTGGDVPCLPLQPDVAGVGSDLWVIGAARGDEAFSVMRGIVSATRTIDGTVLLQTDAAVNPGDSGGAMTDGLGRVRAIVSWKVAGTAYEGIGFGVPIGSALDALDIVLGDRSEADPLAKAGARATALSAPAAPAPATSESEAFAAIYARQTRTRRQRAIGLTVGGVAGVLAGGGMYFGTLGRYLGARDLGADEAGHIDLGEWRRLQGVNATGIAVAGAGAILALVGGLKWEHLPAVAVVPTPGGVQIVGVLP